MEWKHGEEAANDAIEFVAAWFEKCWFTDDGDKIAEMLRWEHREGDGVFAQDRSACKPAGTVGKAKEIAMGAQDVMPAGVIDSLREIHSALDESMGDSEVDNWESDEEWRKEDPGGWAMNRLARLVFGGEAVEP